MAITEYKPEIQIGEQEKKSITKGTIALLGAGQIGTAIGRIAAEANFNVLTKDLSPDPELRFDEFGEKRPDEQVEALHVCIPFKNDKADAFYSSIKDAVEKLKPGMIVLHSTVPLGTTDKLANQTEVPVFHSPVTGNHPDLKKDIQKYFIKFVGGRNNPELAIEHLKKMGIEQVEDAKSSINTEMGKMTIIDAYGLSILFVKAINDLCKVYGADFDTVYKKFMTNYNDGYSHSKPNVHQPVLTPTPGPIGGHCVIPDAILLQKNLDNLQTQISNVGELAEALKRVSSLNKFIIDQNEMYKNESKGGEK